MKKKEKSDGENLDRKSKITEALHDLKGKIHGTVGWGKDLEEALKLKFIPMGVKPLDLFLGGGFARGRFTVIGGPPSGGKSTLALNAIANAQKLGLMCAFVDLERVFDPKWAALQGVNVDDLIVIGGQTIEEALNGLVTLYDTKAVDMVVVDSIAAVSSKGELENKDGTPRDINEDTMALIPRKLSQFFRMATGKNAAANTATLIIAQVRADIGSYGNVEKIVGGLALQHYNSLTLMVKRGPKADAPIDGDKLLGYCMVIKINKTKVSSNEGSEFRIPFIFGKGIDPKMLLVNQAISLGIIVKSGGWFNYSGQKIQGFGKLIEYFNDETILAKLDGEVGEKL